MADALHSSGERDCVRPSRPARSSPGRAPPTCRHLELPVPARATGRAGSRRAGRGSRRVSAFAAATIVTERLLLVPLRPEDADEMVDVLADPRLHQFIGGHPATLEELRARYATLTAGSPRLERRGRWSAGLTADTCTTSSPTSTPIRSRRQRWPCKPVSSPPTTRSMASRSGIDRRAGRGRVAGGADEARAAVSHPLHLPREVGRRPGRGWQQRTGPARPRVGLAAAGVGGHRQGGPADRGWSWWSPRRRWA